jgi:hypothetical protein
VGFRRAGSPKRLESAELIETVEALASGELRAGCRLAGDPPPEEMTGYPRHFIRGANQGGKSAADLCRSPRRAGAEL